MHLTDVFFQLTLFKRKTLKNKMCKRVKNKIKTTHKAKRTWICKNMQPKIIGFALLHYKINLFLTNYYNDCTKKKKIYKC